MQIAKQQNVASLVSSVIAASVSGVSCKRCDTGVQGNYCKEETCPYSDWPQNVDYWDLCNLSKDAIRAKYGVTKRFVVPAVAHDDLLTQNVQFDCAAWFDQADDIEIIQLSRAAWRRDYEADNVALFFEESNAELAGFFVYCRASERSTTPVGFACIIDAQQAVGWVKANRPHLVDKLAYFY